MPASRSQSAALLALLVATLLGLGSAVATPPAHAVTAIIAPSTGTPDPGVVAGYLENARDYYMTDTGCTAANDCDLIGITYPASFWPIFFRPGWCVPGRCEKWNVSLAAGLSAFNGELTNLLATDPEEQIVLFGYSQGAAIVSDQLRLLRSLDPALKQRLSTVLIGNIDNPVGGAWSLLGFLGHIPVLDITTGMYTVTDTGIPTTTINFEYDGVADSPLYWGNLPALLNAAAGFVYLHREMLWPNGYNETGEPNGYTTAELLEQMDPALHPENVNYDSYGNAFITIPTRTLPIMRPFLEFGNATGLNWLVEPLVDLISPALRVIIDTAYDRTLNPGVPRHLSLLPFNPNLNPLDVAADLIDAAGEGVRAFLGHLSPAAPQPSAIAPAATDTSPPDAISAAADDAVTMPPAAVGIPAAPALPRPSRSGGPAAAAPVAGIVERSGGAGAVERGQGGQRRTVRDSTKPSRGTSRAGSASSAAA